MIQSLAVVRIVSHRLLSWPWMNSQTAVMPRSCTSLMNVHAPVSWSSAPRICATRSGPMRSPSFVQRVSVVTPSTWMTSVMMFSTDSDVGGSMPSPRSPRNSQPLRPSSR